MIDEGTPRAATYIFDSKLPRFADVNHYHPVRSFALYKAACTIALLGVKICQGTIPARLGQEMVSRAEEAGLKVLGYAFGCESPETFLRYLPPKEGRIPCLDFEGDTATPAAAEHWVDVVSKAYGRMPWFYPSYVWLERGAPADTLMSQCRCWGSEYREMWRVPPNVGVPVAWQFTDGIRGPASAPRVFPGIGACDVSVLLDENGVV